MNKDRIAGAAKQAEGKIPNTIGGPADTIKTGLVRQEKT